MWSSWSSLAASRPHSVTRPVQGSGASAPGPSHDRPQRLWSRLTNRDAPEPGDAHRPQQRSHKGQEQDQEGGVQGVGALRAPAQAATGAAPGGMRLQGQGQGAGLEAAGYGSGSRGRRAVKGSKAGSAVDDDDEVGRGSGVGVVSHGAGVAGLDGHSTWLVPGAKGQPCHRSCMCWCWRPGWTSASYTALAVYRSKAPCAPSGPGWSSGGRRHVSTPKGSVGVRRRWYMCVQSTTTCSTPAVFWGSGSGHLARYWFPASQSYRPPTLPIPSAPPVPAPALVPVPAPVLPPGDVP